MRCRDSRRSTSTELQLQAAASTGMSFFNVQRHSQQGHSEFLCYRVQCLPTVACSSGPQLLGHGQGGGGSETPLCLACFLDSLADQAVLSSRKIYLVRCACSGFYCCLELAPQALGKP